VSRSVGEVARLVLDSAREPPMRRDHWLNISYIIISESLQTRTKSIVRQHDLNDEMGVAEGELEVEWRRVSAIVLRSELSSYFIYYLD